MCICNETFKKIYFMIYNNYSVRTFISLTLMPIFYFRSQTDENTFQVLRVTSTNGVNFKTNFLVNIFFFILHYFYLQLGWRAGCAGWKYRVRFPAILKHFLCSRSSLSASSSNNIGGWYSGDKVAGA
jgi:hypothetical protein